MTHQSSPPTSAPLPTVRVLPLRWWLPLTLVSGVNLSLLAFAAYLIIHSLQRMRRYDRQIAAIKRSHPALNGLA